DSTTDTSYLPKTDLPIGAIYWHVMSKGGKQYSAPDTFHIIASPQLMAYWSFDSTSGSTYYDVTGHGYDASWTGSGIGTTPGIKGQALSCPGSGYEIDVANSTNNFYFSKFSVECWFYSTISPLLYPVEAKIVDYTYIPPSGGSRNGFTFDVDQQGHVRLTMSSSDGSAWEAASSSTIIQAATWYHLVCTYDSATLKVYVNGSLSGSLSYAGTYVNPANAMHIGCERRTDGSLSRFVNGRIDELKYFNYALTVDSVAAHYNAILHSTPVLIAYTPNPTFNLRPLLQWHVNPAISLFRIQIATDTAFSSPTVSLTTTDTFYLPTADLPLGAIYWRVADEVTAGLDFWSARSSVCILRDSVPVLVPVTPDTQRTQRPRLSWYRVPTAPSSYLLQIDLAGNFATPYFSTTLTADTTYLMTSNLPLGKIFWRVGAVYNTTTLYSSTDTFWITVTGIVPKTTAGNNRPTSASFIQLRRGTAVNYSLEKQSAVSLDIFSIAGSRIATIYRGSTPAGNHSITWDGTGKGGKLMPAGSYLAVFKINERTFTKIIMFMR
ncbi:MAG: LamG-like jellyroll fold domain-containing protein, partial [Chitinispirillaceae bacterium]